MHAYYTIIMFMRNKTNKQFGGFHEVWFMFMELFYSFVILNLSLKFDYGLVVLIFLPVIIYKFVKMAKVQLATFRSFMSRIKVSENTRYVVQKYSIIILKMAKRSHQKVNKISNSKLIEFPSRSA